MNFKRQFLIILLLASPKIFADVQQSNGYFVELNQMGEPAKVLEVKEAQASAILPGQVRVKMLATPIHPSNLLQISGQYGVDPELPSVPGSEGVGQILEVSKDVSYMKKGQFVLLIGGGTWRDEIIGSADKFIPLPELGELDTEVIEQLSMTAVNPVAALLMLTTFVNLKEGDWLVQSAANSAVGGYLIQLAKERGIKTVNVVRRTGLAEALNKKGADAVLIDGPDLAQQIAKATNNEPVSLAIDAVGGQTFSRLANSLVQGGTLVSYGVLSGQPATLNPALTIFNDVRIRGFWLSKWFETATTSDKQAVFGQIIPLIASGALKADVDSRFKVKEIKQAVTRAGQGGRNGKVLLVSE